jgi:uncharacterized OB-fold protein
LAEAAGIKGYTCPQCNWSDFYVAEKCPRCHISTQETMFSPNGRVATFTVIRYPPRGFEKDSPYVVALIDLEKGPRVIGRIIADPVNLEIGRAIRFVRNNNGALEFEV